MSKSVSFHYLLILDDDGTPAIEEAAIETNIKLKDFDIVKEKLNECFKRKLEEVKQKQV
jgi:hypothetical protein